MKNEALSKKKLFFMLLFSPLLMGIIGVLVLFMTGQHPIPHPSNPFHDLPFMMFLIGAFAISLLFSTVAYLFYLGSAIMRFFIFRVPRTSFPLRYKTFIGVALITDVFISIIFKFFVDKGVMYIPTILILLGSAPTFFVVIPMCEAILSFGAMRPTITTFRGRMQLVGGRLIILYSATYISSAIWVVSIKNANAIPWIFLTMGSNIVLAFIYLVIDLCFWKSTLAFRMARDSDDRLNSWQQVSIEDSQNMGQMNTGGAPQEGTPSGHAIIPPWEQ